MQNKRLIAGYRLIFALLGLSAVITEIVTLMARDKFVPANFFSYFTVQSNLLAATILTISAVSVMLNKKTQLVAMLRGANTLNMVVVGVVFAVLLSNLEGNLTAVPWDNTVLHYIIPIVVAIDWLLCSSATKISFQQGLVWIAYPLLYVIYSLVRGHIVDWYPYPFLNPAEQGYIGVIATCALIALGGLGLVYVVSRTSGRRA